MWLLNMHELLTACNYQLVQCSCVDESSTKLCYYCVDHIPHCRPRAAARTHRVLNGDVLSRRIYQQTITKNRSRLSFHSKLGGLLSRSFEMRSASRCSLENAFLWPLGHDTLICAHGITILTNRKPSELVGKRVFYALQVRTRTI